MYRSWAEMAAREFQLFAEQLTMIVDVSELEARADVLMQAVLSPPSQIDRLVTAILWARTVVSIVDHFHPTKQVEYCRCRAVADSAIKRLLALESGPEHVRAWLHEFRAMYSVGHPLCAACSAARMIRADPARHWKIEDMTQVLSVSAARLANAFRVEFGLTAHEYIEVVRLCHALPLLAQGVKVEAVAHDVGYSSKRNFYEMFEKWLRMTPKGLMHLDRRRRESLAASLNHLVLKACTFSPGVTSLRQWA